MNKAWLRLQCKRTVVLAALCAGSVLFAPVQAPAQSTPDIMSSPNVVGSGARALGMGGAFIAIADDATAASWNPGGLTQLERPEFSLVYDFNWSSERFTSGSHPEIDGKYDVRFDGLNYVSFVYPIPRTLAGRNFVLSLNYQRQYDFDRALNFRYRSITGLSGGSVAALSSQVKYRQEGQLGSLSPAFGFEISQRLSVGMVLNLWDESLLPENKWHTEQDLRQTWTINGVRLPSAWVRASIREDYSGFRGTNATFGALYRATDQLQFGLVYHTKFTGDVTYEQRTLVRGGQFRFLLARRPQEITFPSAVGLGAAYRFSNDKLTIALDITRRAWDQFVIHDPRNRDPRKRRISGITGESPDVHDVDPVYTARIGAEYVFVNDKKPIQDVLPSLRAGLFYDPEPASSRPDRFFGRGRGTGKPDDYFGIALGAGMLIKDRINLDAAYVYRWGNGVRGDSLPWQRTDAKVRQHTLYLSTVVYF